MRFKSELLDALWQFAGKYSDNHRDLLGLIDAAVRYRESRDFTPAQLSAIFAAYADLLTMGGNPNDATLEHHREQFVNLDIDISRPLTGII